MPREPHSHLPEDATPLLVAFEGLVRSLYAESRAADWGLTCPQFATALERSAAKRFDFVSPWPNGLEEYLQTLHLEDLALACACLNGFEPAWDYFVREYRGYLRASAAAIIKNRGAGTDAQELADSLFADLYGLADGKRGERSLFRYFHGRSSLKTWLRTVLAQRHIDRLRESRRWESLDPGDGEEAKPVARAAISLPPLDPRRDHYLGCLTLALKVSLAALDSRDRQRLELYYARELTLAEIGRHLGEHESSVSRHLDRCRHELRSRVEEQLRGVACLGEAEIVLCFQYASEDVPIDFRQLFPGKNSGRPGAGRKESS